MWRLRSCPRCVGGDLYREPAWHGEGAHWVCFQCGGQLSVRRNGNGAALASRLAPLRERPLPPPPPRADPPLPPRWEEMEAALALLA